MKLWFAKQRYLIDFTIAALGRRKRRQFSLLAIFTLIVFLLASTMLFSQALQREAALLLAAAPEIVVQRLIAGRHDLIPAAYLEKMGTLRGVQHREGRLWGYFFDPVTTANYTLLVPAEAAPAPGSIAIGEGVARVRGIAVGDILSLRSYAGRPFAFRVEQLINPASALMTADLMLVNEADFREFFGIAPGLYTDLVLEVANPQEVRSVAAKILLALPDTRVILRDEMLRTYQSVFTWREGIVVVVLMSVVFAFAILVWDQASGLSAEERREIGLLKAVGWDTADILQMKLWEGGLIAMTAFSLGYLLAFAHIFYGSAFLFEPVLKGWSTLYPRFTLTPFVDGLQVATLFFFTVAPYTAATLAPIWQAAITDPDTVMRG